MMRMFKAYVNNNPPPMQNRSLSLLLLMGAMVYTFGETSAQCGTTVYDSGGAGGNYGTSQNLTWTYCAPAGQVVTLNFTAFDTEAGYDFLSVHDGNSNLAPNLGTFAGTALPPSVSGTVPGGCVTLWFTSDLSINYAGWAINITCAPVVPPPPVCGSTVYDAGGPGGAYANSTNSLTTYCPSTPGEVVTLNFSQFSTEANFDVLTVYNGPNGGSPSLGSFSGTGVPGPFTSTDPSGCLTVGFISDGSVTYPGWTASVSCATPPPPPAGDCVYALNLFDSFGDGWGTSNVGVSINGGPYTYYTVTGFSNQVLLGIDIGDVIVLSYNNSGGFQGENSYTLGLSSGGTYFNSGTAPAGGVSFTQTANCQPPPAAPQDCSGGTTICSGQAFNNNSSNTGNVVDLTTANQGCLSSGERQGTWYYFSPSASGTIGFTISPTVTTDYDFAVWGPLGAISCPPSGAPLRCSYAAPTGDTGAGNGATDPSETAIGDRWVSPMNVIAGEIYIMYIDNFSSNGQSFDLTWQLSNGASLDCTVLPIGEVVLEAEAVASDVEVQWTTTFERGSSHFIIERSTDGLGFQDIGSQDATGHSEALTAYTFMDKGAMDGLNYYRIRSLGTEGSMQYSPVVSVMVTRGNEFVVAPNPVEQGASLLLRAPMPGRFTMRTIDASGRVVFDQMATLGESDQRLDLQWPGLDAGSYILLILDTAGDVIVRVPFVRQ